MFRFTTHQSDRWIVGSLNSSFASGLSNNLTIQLSTKATKGSA